MMMPFPDNLTGGGNVSYGIVSNTTYFPSAPLTLSISETSKHVFLPASNTPVSTSSDNVNDLALISDFASRVVMAVLFCVVFLFGILGNILVILAVAFSRRLHEIANVFLVNLAMADLLTALFLPVHAATLILDSAHHIPHQFCTFVAASNVATLGCSVITTALIAFSRFHLIHGNRPTKSWTTTRNIFQKRNVIIMVIFAWVYPVILLLIISLTNIGQIGYADQYKMCILMTENESTFDHLGLLVFFLVPFPAFIAIIVCYTLILRTVRHDHRKVLRQMSASVKSTPNSPSEVNLTLLADSLSSPNRRSFRRGRLTRTRSTPLPRAYSSPLPRPRSATNDLLTPPVVRVSPPQQQDSPPSSLSSAKSLSLSSTQLSARPPSPLLSSSRILPLDSSTPPVRPSSLALPSPRSFRRSLHSSLNRLGTPDRSPTSLSVLSRHKSTSNRTLTIQRISKTKLRRMRRSQFRITFNLCMVVCAYTICVMPIAVAVLVPGSQFVLPWLYVLLVLPCCFNPIIYAFKHPNFRGVFGNILHCNWNDIPEPAKLLRTMSTASRSSIRH